MVDTITAGVMSAATRQIKSYKGEVSRLRRTLKHRIIGLCLNRIDDEVYNWIKDNPGYRLYQIDKATLRSHKNWGAKHIVERLIEQGRVFYVCVPRGKQIIKTYWSYER